MDSVNAGKVEIGANDLVPGSLGFSLSGVSGSVIGGSAHTVSSSHAQDLKEEIGASAEKTRRERIEDEFNSIGRLESSAEDYMTLHTREAYQLFVGRAGTQKRIVGATTAAAGSTTAPNRSSTATSRGSGGNSTGTGAGATTTATTGPAIATATAASTGWAAITPRIRATAIAA